MGVCTQKIFSAFSPARIGQITVIGTRCCEEVPIERSMVGLPDYEAIGSDILSSVREFAILLPLAHEGGCHTDEWAFMSWPYLVMMHVFL